MFAGVIIAVLAVVLLNHPDKSAAPGNLQTDSTSVVAEIVPATPAEPEVPSVIELQSISLSKSSLTLEEGGSTTLTVKYTPGNATDKTTTWKSTDASIAKVSTSGKVTAVKSGSAAIIASCQGKDAYCNVTVKAEEVQPSKPEQIVTQTAQSALATTGTHNGHEWVDLGLSVKWATMNVGATSPGDYGSYFAWGETKPKSYYNWSTYKWCKGSYDTMTKYCTRSEYGTVDNKTVLDLADDAARANWGGSWRMPTLNEIKELEEKCTCAWTMQNGVKGYKVTSKKNGNSIFLPAAGDRWNDDLYNAGSDGHYWSSTLSPSCDCNACRLYFDSGFWNWNNDFRNDGQSVRAVCP